MKVEQIKQELEKHLGENATITYHLGRNKFEEFHGTIKQLYDYVFLVETKDEMKQEIISFSYSDVISKTIHILY